MSIALAKEFVAIALYVLGGVPIDTHKDLHRPAGLHHQGGLKDRIGPGFQGAPSVQDIRLRTYLYQFEGKAMFKGRPCAGAKVILRLITSRTSEIRQTATGEDGSYQIAIKIEGSRHEPVDFSMNAYTPDMRRVEFVSRRIVMREDEDTVTVHNTLNLLQPGA